MSVENKNVEHVRSIIRRSENPHPITIIIISVISLLSIYLLYTYCLKPDISGVWVCEKQHHVIKYDKWSDTINVDGKYYGTVSGNTVILYMNGQMKMGVWVKDIIEWTDGEKWQSAYGY